MELDTIPTKGTKKSRRKKSASLALTTLLLNLLGQRHFSQELILKEPKFSSYTFGTAVHYYKVFIATTGLADASVCLWLHLGSHIRDSHCCPCETTVSEKLPNIMRRYKQILYPSLPNSEVHGLPSHPTSSQFYLISISFIPTRSAASPPKFPESNVFSRCYDQVDV